MKTAVQEHLNISLLDNYTILKAFNMLKWIQIDVLFYHSTYRNDPKFLDEQVWANQGLHGLPFRLHLLDTILYGTATLFEF